MEPLVSQRGSNEEVKGQENPTIISLFGSCDLSGPNNF